MDKEMSTDEHHHSEFNESARNEDILSMRLQGRTLQEIGNRHGITRERVRQVLLRSKGPTSAEAHKARSTLSLVAFEQLRTQVQELMDRGIFETSAIAKTLGVTDSQVRSCLSAGERKMLIKTVIQPKLWEDEEILSALKSAASLAGNLTVTSYAAAVKSGAVDGPTPAVVLHRFGGWIRACEAAGIVSTATPRKRWGISSSQVLSDLIRFLDAPGTSKTAAAYESWARSNNAVSLGTIRNKVGGWSAALILARKRQRDR